MKPVVFALTAAIAGMSLAPCANAEFTTTRVMLDDFDHADAAGRDLIETVVLAEADGIAWADSYIAGIRQEPHILCIPDTFPLTGPRVLDILRREAKKSQLIMNMPYGNGILIALLLEFGCQK